MNQWSPILQGFDLLVFNHIELQHSMESKASKLVPLVLEDLCIMSIEGGTILIIFIQMQKTDLVC